ncbi:lysine-rich arabinogalactan protein 19-like [Phragmites australis]|uniref:lysine-rich arabinogalactan protein 19-like n=1 Tax=Phragmites australis TaxID=29695 RepID=UPI002D7925CF|nr:lysine-rich arabinogalactan protein 19-like [Phragmites australis]XP_062223353.1 lysine-rich arabinogalactan protein 19-like [Phragmites australis]XP_062223354.1 lysine-rich arabinogalactan protein 19-like [Phragmites australis]
MGSSSSPSPPPPPMIGRAGNLTVFITPPSPVSTPRGSTRPPPESPRSDFSTPTPHKVSPPPASPSPSPSPKKSATPPTAPVVFTPRPPPVKVPPPPVQVPPPQYEKASAGGKHDGSAFGFFWDAVARVQEAHASLDEYVANWFGLDQSKYQWALNDYYEATGKEADCVKPGKPKEVTAKVQKV